MSAQEGVLLAAECGLQRACLLHAWKLARLLKRPTRTSRLQPPPPVQVQCVPANGPQPTTYEDVVLTVNSEC